MKKNLNVLVFLFLTHSLLANNIQLSNISVTNNPANNATKLIHFDITWENSWRRLVNPPSNWDGAWVFFKFKDNDGTWQPIRFTGTDITAPAGSAYEVGNNGTLTGVGMFIFRSANGSGTFSVTDFTAAITSYPGTYEVRGFALEMVHIPTGSYYLGDGSSLGTYNDSNLGTTPYLVTSNSITIGTAPGQLYDSYAPTFSGGLGAYPKAYNSFWMMKYELSVGGYRDYLNTLTYQQQVGNFYTGNPAAAVGSQVDQTQNSQLRIAVSGVAPNTPAVVGANADNDLIYNEANDGEWNAYLDCNYIEVASYLDWAGLRMMSDLEFEKAARGPLTPIADEYAWGNNSLATIQYNFTNSNTNNETVTNSSSVSGNAIIGSLTNFTARRGGIFGTNVSNRVSAGAGYYGAMDLTGMLYELVVTTQNVAGRSYTGKNGDGILTVGGRANENYWPGVNGATGVTVSAGEYVTGGTGVTSKAGINRRGGLCNASVQDGAISRRVNAGNTFQDQGPFNNTSVSDYFAIRGVRDSSL